MKVVVDQDKCIGSGQCVLASEQVFDQRDEDGIVVLLQDDPAAELHEGVRQAAQVCPALAIEVNET
ncbi:ferredoxin [Nocardia alni]|uniref:ferredoxin n=1 Tax=Nocardia alni TaxID=2815723 RepID=UPI001C22326A|nr:ferredoxin [Nocardia alni]